MFTVAKFEYEEERMKISAIKTSNGKPISVNCKQISLAIMIKGIKGKMVRNTVKTLKLG
jgi:expansin (peptidoglycan-binding protein)